MKTLDEPTREDKVAIIKNWVEELAQEDTTRTELLERYRKLISGYQISTEVLINENEKLKNSKSLSEEDINNLVNDKIATIFRNPLTYLMGLPVNERNELIGRIYTAIIGVKFR
jgi:hypothetical protein